MHRESSHGLASRALRLAPAWPHQNTVSGRGPRNRSSRVPPMAIPPVLRSLLTAHGPSGYETAPATVFRDAASAFADVVTDVMGSVWARVPGTADGPTLAIVGHIDEIGLIVTHIDDDGFLRFRGVGGWDAQILVGQRVRLGTRDGALAGVVGKKPIHLLKEDERKKVARVEEMHIDIGAKDGEEARGLVRVGDVVAVAAVQEETTFAGAATTAYALRPDVAIIVDVTHATDAPGVEPAEIGAHPFGSGPVIERGSNLNPRIVETLYETAEAEGIPFTVQASARATGTDLDAIHLSRGGVPCGGIGIPLRYMHSPVEMVQLDDVDNAARLVAAVARRLTPETSFAR